MKYSWNCFCIAIASVMLMSSVAHAQLTEDQWRADIDTLAENLLDRHPNFYTKHTVEEFEDALDALDAQLNTLNDQQIVMEICRLVALGGDAHTNVGFNAFTSAMHTLPVQCIVLADGVFVSNADKRYEDLIGVQILKFAGIASDEAFERVGELFGHENYWKLINAGSMYVTLLPALSAVEIIDEYNASAITLTIKDEDGTREIELDCTPPTPEHPRQWSSFTQRFKGEMPLAYRKSRGYYQSEFISEHKAMYVAYNKCYSSEDFPLTLFTQFVMEKSEEFDAERIIIDLRLNPGGDETVLWPMIDALKASERFKGKGDIIALTGRWTFSSAMSNAHQLRDRAGAVLMGEPTGGKPNHFGALGSFVLPNSKLTIHHSTRRFEKVPGDPDAVYPQVLIEVSSNDFFAGIDPVLEAAFNYEDD